MSHLMETMKTIEAAEIAPPGSASEAAEMLKSGQSVDPPEGKSAADVWRPGDPDVSDMVIYQPRRGEVRRGRKRIAALVTHRYPDARVLDLAIIYEASDTMDQQRVPEAVGEERGWIVKNGAVFSKDYSSRDLPNDARITVNHAPAEIAQLRASIADLRAIVMGEFETPQTSVLDMLCELDERVDGFAASQHQPASVPAPKWAPKPGAKPGPKSKKRGK